LVVGETASHVQVQRLLGVLSYEFVHRGLGRTYSFATYCFLVQMPVGASLQPRDESESIGGWQWRSPEELTHVAAYLENIAALAPAWGDWGRYRALSHRLLAEILA
jgi:hypothetical protein